MGSAFRIGGLLCAAGAIVLVLSLRFAPLLAAPLGETLAVGQVQSQGTERLFAPGGDAEKERLAERLLRDSPLNGTALVLLEARAEAEGNGTLAARMTDAAAGLGWRDHQAQRLLYNDRFERGDYATAMTHGDALLRQDSARDELFDHFTSMLSDPPFRSALAATLATSPRWAGSYLQHALEEAPSGDLLGLLDDLAGPDGTVPKRAGERFFARFRQRGEYDAAAMVARRMGEPAGGIPPFAIEGSPGAPYAWQLANGFTVQSGPDGAELDPPRTAKRKQAFTYLTLPAGTYRIATAAGAFPETEWGWELNCEGRRGSVVRLPGNHVSIEARCPLQRLRVWPRQNNAAALPSLTAMRGTTR